MSISYILIPLVGELLSLVLLVEKIPTTAQISYILIPLVGELLSLVLLVEKIPITAQNSLSWRVAVARIVGIKDTNNGTNVF